MSEPTTICPVCVHVHADYNDEPCVSCGCDPTIAEAIDAFLASPQAAEELARCLHPEFWADAIPHEACCVPSAQRVLTAWQKVRHPEEAPE